MADSTTFLETLSASQANKELRINELVDALSPAAVYGRRASTTSALTWGYFGGPGPFNATAVANGTVALTGSTTNYIVAARASGVVSVSTSATNWNNTTDYARIYSVVAGASSVTSYEDHRFRPNGTHVAVGVGGGSGGVELKGLTFNSDTDSVIDTDPGAGVMKWNHATQSSATFLYLDTQTADGVSLSTFYASLVAGGFVYLQQGDDATKWQLWRVTSSTSAAGYHKLGVALQAYGGAIADAETVYVDFQANDTTSLGRHDVPISAPAMAPSTVGGCAALAVIASAADQPDIATLDFDASTPEYAQFAIAMPKSWNGGTITFKPIWSHAATTTNFGVVWSLQLVVVRNDDGIAVAFGTAQTSTDTGGTTNDLYYGPESAAITPAGTVADDCTLFGRISRVTGDAGDTMAIDARLHGIVLGITTDAGTDA